MTGQLRNVLLGFFLAGVASQSLAEQGVGGNPASGFVGDFPLVSGKAALTVTGRGYHHRELYNDGEVPTLSAYDGEGELLPDGIYRFQFTSTPDGSSRSIRQREVMRGGASRSGDNGGNVSSRLSGTFEVLGGNLSYR